MEKLPIIFRKDRGKDPSITAVFPTEVAGPKFGDMTCYAHIGQHSGCSFAWYHTTRAAKPAEYADLLAELRQIYEEDDDEPVKLIVYRRMQPAHRDAYQANWKRIYNNAETADR